MQMAQRLGTWHKAFPEHELTQERETGFQMRHEQHSKSAEEG